MMDKPIELRFDTAHGTFEISNKLYGIFLEDINFSCDGGLNANQIENYSFDGVYLDKEAEKPIQDNLRYWKPYGLTMTSGQEAALSENSRYARLEVDGQGYLYNLGYNGHSANAGKPAISIAAGSTYEFKCQIRNVSYAGDLTIQVQDEENLPLTDRAVIRPDGSDWQEIKVELFGSGTGYGQLAIGLSGTGQLDLDCVSLMDTDVWHKDDPRWRHGKLRKDLVQALADMKPRFMRFPGGCIVEGDFPGNEYNWKDTVGQLYERKSNYNLWSEKLDDGGYNQSYQIGFYEYFCLCEDLGMEPLPTLSAGINCQIRAKMRRQACPKIPLDSPRFETEIINNYLDLIEFANGDPATSRWAALRASMGHEAPFNLRLIGIGNENYGRDYRRRFAAIASAIHQKHPEIECVICTGIFPYSWASRHIRRFVMSKFPGSIVDEHSYHSPQWFIKAARRFDRYPRGHYKIYMGEYSANGLFAGKKQAEDTSNTYESALAEAAFLTGVERNADLVEMTSYAPLFNLVGSRQWFHNLIDFNPATVSPTANYLVQQIFSSHIGSRYVPCQGNLPKDIFVSATLDADKLYIKLVNTGSLATTVDLNIKDLQDQSFEADVLQSNNLTARNSLAFKGAPDEVLRIQKVQGKALSGRAAYTAEAQSVQVLTLSVQ